MEALAKLNSLRIAARKVRLIADLVRGKDVEAAQGILEFTIKKGSEPLLKLLNSAVANAKDNNLDVDNLYVSKITVDEGRKLKRWRPRARGRASAIEKKTSNITLVLNEIKPGKKVKKKEKPEKPNQPELESKEITKKEISPEDIKKQREKSQMDATSKPKGKGGVKRMFRRKSF